MSPWQDDAPPWRDDEFWFEVEDEDMPDEIEWEYGSVRSDVYNSSDEGHAAL